MATNKRYSKDFHFIRQLKNIVTSKKVIISILVTLFFMVLYNFVSKISMPYLKIDNTSGLNQNALYNILNMLGGGGITNMSMFAIGISPYITTQIIVQLLSSDVIPPLARLAKSGERGRKKIEMISRVFCLPFSILQAYSIFALFSSQGIQIKSDLPASLHGFFYITLMVAGTYIAIFFSDLITKRGVGNGVTTIILCGIVSTLVPNFIYVKNNIDTYVQGQLYQLISFIVYIIFYLAILWVITFVNCSSRKIPIQQTGQSLMKLGDDLPYLPFKLNTGGVIPVIFASSIMSLPLTISEIVKTNTGPNGFTNFSELMFSFSSWAGIIVYCVLIILFTFFYSYVQLNPNKISNDFMKSGRFIIGVKIGKETEKYISQVLYRINWIGGPFLAVIASLAYVASIVTTTKSGVPIIPSNAALGGTGIIILVSGTLDLWQSIVSVSTTTSYKIMRKRMEIDDAKIIGNDQILSEDVNSVLW